MTRAFDRIATVAEGQGCLALMVRIHWGALILAENLGGALVARDLMTHAINRGEKLAEGQGSLVDGANPRGAQKQNRSAARVGDHTIETIYE